MTHVISPTTQPHASCCKARANSDDYYVDSGSGCNNNDTTSGNHSGNRCASQTTQSSSFNYDAYSLQRAVSSEARLPSRQEPLEQQHDDCDAHDGGDDDDELEYCPIDGDGLDLSSSNETDERIDDSATRHNYNRNRILERRSTSYRITPSPRSKKMPKPPPQQLKQHYLQQQPKHSITSSALISRCVSDTTHSGSCSSTGSAARRILQTIESGMPLDTTIDDNNTVVATTTTTTTTPKPPRRSSALHRGDYINNNNNNSPSQLHHPPHHQSQHSNVSFTSHYSVDAGKHGFLSHSPPPSPPARLNHSFSYGDEDSTAEGGGGDANSIVSNGSLVFKYMPGQETPPAEYALPVSILKVYGDALVDEIGLYGTSGGGGVIRDTIPLRRKVFVESYEKQRQVVTDNTTTVSPPHQSALPLPPPMTILGDATTTTTSAAGPSLPEQQQQQRILPYHERKRLSVLLVEKEKQRQKKSAATATTNTRNLQQANSRINGGMALRTSEKDPLNGVRSGGYGGTTSLLAIRGINNNNFDVEDVGGDDNVANHHGVKPHLKDTREWFGQLVAIITGKSNSRNESDGVNEEKTTEQRGMGKYQDPKQTFRDQAEAFLKKTESERMKVKARKQSLDRSWAKRSSLSAALDSIPSCSGEEEEENEADDNDTNESYSSDEEEDEECGSFYFGNRNAGGGGGATVSSKLVSGLNNTPKVWSYGEPPTTMDHNTTTKKHAAPKKHRISEHDLIMRRERLLQEEYEYRLRALQREHANLSKKFRIFVLVTVAIIFTGALTFAFVVCVRMLMSI